jgi:hypothetical protein
MGSIGDVVVNTIVRMFTKKAVGKAMKSAKSLGGAKAKKVAKTGQNRP